MWSSAFEQVDAVNAPPIETQIIVVEGASGISQTLMNTQIPQGSW